MRGLSMFVWSPFLWPISILLIFLFCLFHVNDSAVIKRSPQYSGYSTSGNPPLFIDWTQPRNGGGGGYYPNYGSSNGCSPSLRRFDESGESVRIRPEIRRVKVVGASSEEEVQKRLPPCPPTYSQYYPRGGGRDYGPFGVGLAGLPSAIGDGGISPAGWLQGILFGG